MRECLLHIGLEWRHLPAAWVRLQHYRASLLLDRWDAWGEALEHAPLTPFGHVVVIGTSLEHDALLLALDDVLARVPGDTCIAVETLIEDWRIEEVGGRVWHRLDGDREEPIVIEVHPWRD